MAPFDRSHTSSYSFSVVTMAVSCIVFIARTDARCWYNNSARPSVCISVITIIRRAFSVATPTVWNALPNKLRLSSSLSTFKKHLRPIYSDTTQLNWTSSWVELRRRSVLRSDDATQLNSTSSWVELSCVAINGPLKSLLFSRPTVFTWQYHSSASLSSWHHGAV